MKKTIGEWKDYIMNDSMSVIKKALSEKSAVSFNYEKADGDSSFRNIVPEDVIIASDSNPLVVGVDQDVQGYRRFNLSRMTDVKLSVGE